MRLNGRVAVQPPACPVGEGTEVHHIPSLTAPTTLGDAHRMTVVPYMKDNEKLFPGNFWPDITAEQLARAVSVLLLIPIEVEVSNPV
jgi:hypothetical protein